MARRSANLVAAALAAVAAVAVLSTTSAAFLPAGKPSTRTGAMTAAGAAAVVGSVAPAFAEEAAKHEEGGLLNFGKVELGGGFAINLDIPETGIINIVVLIAGLLYLLSPILSESMASREKEIQSDIDDAIAKYNEATARLAEAEKNKAQADQVVAEIMGSIAKDQADLEQTMKSNAAKSIERQDKAALSTMKEMEIIATAKIENFIQEEAIKRGLNELRGIKKDQAKKFMDNAIASL
eukprot:gb/GFBE01055844.1/.p1 GENE.gb/GFBE01055844.1/~~gb/GFBE01055844.1/.p1  ORF type:complete len:238 (+),score=106.34 gb/GFBE01055844.1/:1-714(+)